MTRPRRPNFPARPSLHPWALLVFAAALGWGCSPGPGETPTVDVGPSFRILTWNVAFIPDAKDVNDGTWADDEERADFVAQKLLDSLPELDPDIMVFNEAFNIEPQDVFSSAFCNQYPNFLRFLDESWDDQHQDSGLMLFSRHPFANLNLTNTDFESSDHLAFTGCVADDADDDDPKFWDSVGFVLYPFSSCFSFDCLANKGVGALRVQHTASNDFINLAFSHLQASDGDDPDDEADYQSGRAEQIGLMEDLIEAIPDWADQRTYVMGDLNVRGQGCGPGGCSVPNVPAEWTTHFGSGDFFGCGAASCGAAGSFFRDSWAFDMPTQDLGRSYMGSEGPIFLNETKGERLDYILHNIPSPRLQCLQHMRVLRHLGTDDGTHASDHLPVWAEFNYRAPLCNPVEAEPVTAPEFYYSGNIRYPRGVQWYRVDAVGTWSVNLPSDMGFEVYSATDMSYPIAPFDPEEGEYGIAYKLPSPPYYIKVFADSRTWTGDYQISVHQHQCGPFDCCALTPGDTDGVQVPFASGDVSSPSRWFCFDTDVSDAGLFPSLSFHQEGICNSLLEQRLFDSDGNAVSGMNSVPGAVENTLDSSVSGLAPGRYTLELHRSDDNTSGACWASLEYYTNLTFFYPETLVCHDETGANGTAEEIGHDEIYTLLQVDEGCGPNTDHTLFTYLYDFDEDDSKPKGLKHFGVRKYVRCTVMNLLEEDDIGDGDVTHLQTVTPIETLALDTLRTPAEHVWNNGDYTYQMIYRLSHEPWE